MPTKPEKHPKRRQPGKKRDPGKSAHSLNPDEVISEINHQSTALQKIVSRFLDPVADEDLSIKKKKKK